MKVEGSVHVHSWAPVEASAAYTVASAPEVPAYTLPPTTAGEVVKPSTADSVHPTCRLETVEGDSTFSYGFSPEWSGPNLNMGQSVRTVNGARADRPEVSPVAVTAWSPGRAEAGTLRGKENAPAGSVVAVPSGWESKDRSTVSVGPNPWPPTVIRVVGGPTVLDRRTRAPDAAGAGPARARTRSRAVRPAAAGPRPFRRTGAVTRALMGATGRR